MTNQGFTNLTTNTTDNLHYRPVDIDVWYSSGTSATDTILLVYGLLKLLEQRTNYYTASNAGNGAATQIAQLYANGFQCSDSAKVLRFKTNSFKNTPMAKGKFPLVVYMIAHSGMSYENFTFFEALAQAGFIVVLISFIGSFPGDMTMKKTDLMEQANNAVTAFSVLNQDQRINFYKIGIVGYRWGDLAGAILAGKIKNVDCLISLDGSEFYHYGDEKRRCLF